MVGILPALKCEDSSRGGLSYRGMIEQIASEYGEDVLIRPTTTLMPKGEARVFIYFPTIRESITSKATEVVDIDEAEDLLKEKGLL